jgi:hypothetical protein
LWFGFKKPQNRTPSGVVAVLEVRLWYYRKNRGCILNKGACLNFRSNCILYRGNCLIYKGGCNFAAVVAYLKNMRFWWLNHNRGFGYCFAVLVRLRCYFFKCGSLRFAKNDTAQGSSARPRKECARLDSAQNSLIIAAHINLESARPYTSFSVFSGAPCEISKSVQRAGV